MEVTLNIPILFIRILKTQYQLTFGVASGEDLLLKLVVYAVDGLQLLLEFGLPLSILVNSLLKLGCLTIDLHIECHLLFLQLVQLVAYISVMTIQFLQLQRLVIIQHLQLSCEILDDRLSFIKGLLVVSYIFIQLVYCSFMQFSSLLVGEPLLPCVLHYLSHQLQSYLLFLPLHHSINPSNSILLLNTVQQNFEILNVALLKLLYFAPKLFSLLKSVSTLCSNSLDISSTRL